MGVIRRLALVTFFAVVACAPATTTIGPLTMRVPEGWLVTDREGTNLKITDGTVADENSTKAGTATAVFDIYVEHEQTPDAFGAYLREQDIRAERSSERVGGYASVVFRYRGASVGGRQEAVFVPRWRVFILYRAAFPGADAAFLRGRDDFRRAVDSITFSGSSATGSASRQGPKFGSSAMTASAVPIAMSTNPN